MAWADSLGYCFLDRLHNRADVSPADLRHLDGFEQVLEDRLHVRRSGLVGGLLDESLDFGGHLERSELAELLGALTHGLRSLEGQDHCVEQPPEPP